MGAKEGATAAFGHAIPTGSDGKADCHAVGASCDVDKVLTDEAKEKADAAKKDPVDAEAEKIAKEEVEGAAKKEKAAEAGEAAKTDDAAAAFAQRKSVHKHHKKH